MNNKNIIRTSIDLSQSGYVRFVKTCFDEDTTPDKVLGEAARKYLILKDGDKNKARV